MRYYLETYGCQMNVADSELIAGLMEQTGHARTDQPDDAGIIFLNTCAIREKAEETVHHRLEQLGQLKRGNPSLLIGLLGCMAKHVSDSLLETKPYLDMVLGPDSYRRIPEFIEDRQSKNDHVVDTKLSRFEVYDDLFPSRASGVNAWVSIMRGCDKFCSFCVVPFTRGRERSRSLPSIVAEVEEAVNQGYPEITLLGQNVNSYRHENHGFPDLLETVARVSGLRRIRFTSPHPSDVDTWMLEVMASHENICKLIHLPLQAGADRILQRMNRTYTQADYLDLVDRIRRYIPECTLSTDLIVGFPGETESEFMETLRVVEKVGFDSAYTFKYSVRGGTKAAEYTDQVPEVVKQERLERLIPLQKELTVERNRRYIGRELEVLVEKESKKSSAQWAGRTDGNQWVIFDKSDARIKDFVTVHIDSAHGIILKGHLATLGEVHHAIG